MIHEIHPHRFNNQYQPNAAINENDHVFHIIDNTLLLKNNGEELSIPQVKDLGEIASISSPIFLFTLNDVACFLIWDKPKVDDSQFVYKEISIFRTMPQQAIGWVIVASYHLKNWYAQHKYCGQCGALTQHKEDERALQCTSCKMLFFPKISPAIIVAIICNDKILLARNSNFIGGMYSLVAGYVDIGESLEETVAREVKEEVGITVKNVRYYKSQPWPLTGAMMIGFVAEADEDQTITIDNKEIADAAWFTKDNMPNHSSTLSIAGEMIEQFKLGLL